MLLKRALRQTALVLFIPAVASFLYFCREDRPGGLQFVRSRPSSNRQQANNLVVVTHGWVEKGHGDWPEGMACAIYNRVDANSWRCGYFDWAKGAKTVNPTDAAEYARDMAGPQLAEQIVKISSDWRHIHLIGHSCGCWVVSEAAKILARNTKPHIHLTFLDAYVPVFWKETSLGDVNAPADVNVWAEQYYTRDLTLRWTQQDLTFAHNVDITSINGVLRDHNFPWQWYFATIIGKYPRDSTLRAGKPVDATEGIEYGFARSREAAGYDGWNKSLKLPAGSKAVKVKLP
ncbi:MAG: lipase family protein [Planctomycetota bacterium]|jgi:predicted alpha/beta hydrolase family esterase